MPKVNVQQGWRLKRDKLNRHSQGIRGLILHAGSSPRSTCLEWRESIGSYDKTGHNKAKATLTTLVAATTFGHEKGYGHMFA